MPSRKLSAPVRAPASGMRTSHSFCVSVYVALKAAMNSYLMAMFEGAYLF